MPWNQWGTAGHQSVRLFPVGMIQISGCEILAWRCSNYRLSARILRRDSEHQPCPFKICSVGMILGDGPEKTVDDAMELAFPPRQVYGARTLFLKACQSGLVHFVINCGQAGLLKEE